ncbi:MarR family transcriptional regulator [Nocardioides mangrovicus]|uniref:MarR family transcriptional regulator n=1 Tax=Nocardioides mangrovicus TaxID=2478913 RepID=A0A3L8NXV3_9ACTN|nr:MarR family transcriptional regulator [Nocardioides mangrovicus]
MERVARTDAGLASELRVSVMRLRRRLSNQREATDDLSVGARSALGVLFREGEMTVGQLAAHERVQPPSMTRTVACLVDGGYVERRQDEHDKRQVLVAISAEGTRRLQADRRRRDEWLAQRLHQLTPDERAVLRQAAPILERLASLD